MSEVSNKRKLIKGALLGFKQLSWAIRNNRHEIRLSNLAIFVLLLMHDSKPLLRSEIMKAMKSNYYDIDSALKQLESNRLANNESSYEGRFNNTVVVKTKRYRTTLKGELYIERLLDQL